MKKYIYLQIIGLLTAILFGSCSSTNYLTMTVTEPAPVFFPKDIQKIGIVDRTLPSDETEKLDKIDKILSLEGKELDKDGAHKAVVGLSDELTSRNAFESVKILNTVDERSPGMGVFPAALPWTKIEDICNSNNVDVVFVLSFYDTDTKVDYKTVPVEVKNPFGVVIKTLEHQATIITNIKTGWRIYDPVGKILRDEIVFKDRVVSTGKGINPLKAVNAVVGRKEAVMKVSNDIGHNYAGRIFPYNIRVSRDYYVRGTDNFKIGKRRAQTGNWDGAAELWEKEVDNPKRKVAGRACYNMAIINEINGDLDAAIDWASRSYTDYKDKLALRYLNILKNRYNKQQELNQ